MATPETRRREPLDLSDAKVPRGQIYVLPQRCKGCDFCVTFCPVDVLVMSEDINAKGYHFPIVASGKEESCTHCRFCDFVCPEMAIYTEDLNAHESEASVESD
ncbi:MAG TPA: 4Fe-4S dicluster domain-containing protein [Gammaproteobacteria bacterium]|nr:4Fe-4S dicluster domain-containing protein [Gammaproteobacteria bacterium]